VSRRVVPLTLDNLADLPEPCRACVFWETGHRRQDSAAKEDWLSAVLLEWGSCGRVLYVDGRVAGFATYAPPQFAVGASRLAASEVSSDAVLLMTVSVAAEHSAAGLGRILVQSVVKDLMGRRGVRALEAFGDLQAHELGCTLPVGFLTSVGFKTVHQHPRYPRLRLDLRSVLTWATDVEGALERWLDVLRPDPAGGPAPAFPRASVRTPGTPTAG
jgi:GNAT superfamily N-acetyltransferase